MKFITNSRLYKKYNEKYNLDKYLPVFYYLFFGVVSTIVNIAVYALFARVFKVNYQVSNVIAWISAIIVAYTTNKKFVFKNGADKKKSIFIEIIKFVSVRIATLVIEIIIMFIGVKILKIDDIIMKCISNVIVIITNYFMSRYIVFTNKKKLKVVDEKNADKVFTINISFFILLFITLIVILNDYIIYFLNIDYVISLLFSFIIILAVSVILIKFKKLNISNTFNKIDLIFIGFMLIFCASSIVFPDNFWDTKSYHIYLQENPFIDKVSGDFFPGRTLNSFLFPLADRIYYLFRYFLGYRLGTIISYYLFIVLFYQIKRIIKKVFNDNISENVISLISALPLFMFSILELAGKYYIDLFSVTFLLEAIYIILFNRPILKNKFKAYYLALIVGITISIKVSNVAFLVPLFIYFVILNRNDFKYLKVYDYLIALILILFPFLIYAYDNFIQTGSPLYPYYNNIFNSELFINESWSDKKFGGKNILEKILWPFYGITNPNRLYDYGGVDPIWQIGYIVSFSYLLLGIIKVVIKNNREKKLDNYSANRKLEVLNENEKYMCYFSGVIFSMYLIWEFLLGGYVRYALIIPVCSYILTLLIIISLLKKKKLKIIFILLLTSILVEIGYDIYEYFSFYHRSFATYTVDFGLDASKFIYKNNAKELLKDRNIGKIHIDEDEIFGVIYDDSWLPTLFREDDSIPIVSIDKRLFTDKGYGANEKLESLFYKVINGKKVNLLVNTNNIQEKVSKINKYNYTVESINLCEETNVIAIDEDLYLIKLNVNNEVHKNPFYSDIIDKNKSYNISKYTDDFKITLALSSNTKININSESKMNIYLLNSTTGEKKLIDECSFNIGVINTFEMNIQKISGYDSIIFETDDSRNYRVFIY